MEYSGEPYEMVELVSDAVSQMVQDWCRNGGDYSLQRKALRYIEIGYGVKEQYSKSINFAP